MVHTSALSRCRTQRHLPSGDMICSAETGWLQRMVTLPVSYSAMMSMSMRYEMRTS